jgi:tripartite-type tricarboxylate transporter receptor subunit TctC
MKTRIALRWAQALTGLFLLAGAASARADFPEREISLIVNYGAGGTTDVTARVLAKGMEKPLGKPVVVINKPGAEGTIGPAFLAVQKPDGYTVGVVTYSTVAIQPHLRDLPYTIRDFEFIAGYGRFRYGVVVRADSPYKSIDDLVRAAKGGKGIFFGAPSAPNNLAMFELGRKTGAKFEQAPYKSGSETVIALLGGQVEAIVQNPSDVIAHIRDGKLRLLASASPVRWREFPNVATLKEAGYDVEIDSWLGVAVPKGTPREIVAKLQQAVAAAMKDPEVVDKITLAGVDPEFLTGTQYATLLATGAETMGRALKAAGLAKP